MTKREEKQVNSIFMRFYAIINGCGFQLNNLQGGKPPSRNFLVTPLFSVRKDRRGDIVIIGRGSILEDNKLHTYICVEFCTL